MHSSHPSSARSGRVRLLAAGALVSVLALSACSSSHNSTSAPTTSPPTPGASNGTGSPTTNGSGKPTVPASGAYLGAWVNVQDSATVSSAQRGPTNASAFASAIGRPLGITHNFISWTQAVPVSDLQSESAQGTIPMVDWHCGAADSAVASGADDKLIASVADALKSVGHPVFLRWYWEMAFNTDPQSAVCRGTGNSAELASNYVAAWKHIWTVFQQQGATNVAFVWCPGGNGVTTKAVPYYPGAQYVDWIAEDIYALKTADSSTFAKLVKPFYDYWQTQGKPLMIAETGSPTGTQAAFLQGAASTLQSQMTDIKALLYFDGQGPRGNWSLDSAGLAEFKSLASSSYFTSR